MKTEIVKIQELQIEGITYVPKDSIIQNQLSIEGLPFVMIRTYSAGVHMGYLSKRESTLAGIEITLINTTRIWSWSGACSLSQLALEGTKNPEGCKLSVELPSIELIAIEIIPMNSISFDNLNKIKRWKK